MEGAVQVIFALLKSVPMLRVDTEGELNLMFHLNYWTFSWRLFIKYLWIYFSLIQYLPLRP